MAMWWWLMLATTALKPIATSSSCTEALPGLWRDRHWGDWTRGSGWEVGQTWQH
uniref:Alternative protein TRIM3 n=1 Tax=Homo sapiens TaxID=9606 RepID=L8EAL7_HUMAN|nr:alternative protein TRIM3 [Homo sapiens]